MYHLRCSPIGRPHPAPGVRHVRAFPRAPHTAVSTLRRGEDHGLGEYEDVLQNEDVSVECKYLIRNELQARCKDHVQALDRVSQGLTQSGK